MRISSLPIKRLRPWLLPVAALLALMGAGAYIIYRVAWGPLPPFLEDKGHGPQASSPQPVGGPSPLRLAGSGCNLPLTRRLAQAFASPAGVAVLESIGSRGGIQAVRDGAIGLGLISRPLTAKEQRLGLKVIPYARAVVVVAAHPSVADDEVDSATLLEIYGGQRSHWRNGLPIVVLQRERGDSSHLALNRVLPGFSQANEEAYLQGRWRVLYHDLAMQEALLSTEGGVGLFDLGTILCQSLPLKALRVDGVEPSVQSVLAGRYPYFRDLAMVSPGPPRGEADSFIRFVLSPRGQDLIRRLGYLPLGQGVGP